VLAINIRKTIWIGFLLSGTVVYAIDLFVVWADGTVFADDSTADDIIGFEAIYFLSLACLLIWRLFVNRRAAIKPLLALTLTGAVIYFLTAPIQKIAFEYYIYPEQKFLSKHCHPIPFQQDGRTFYLGVCDVVFVDGGQNDFSFVYDTSGDVANDEDEKESTHRRDRIEWVNAMRRFFNDDPNEQFEIGAFYTREIYKNFYTVKFDDEFGEGFTLKYGPPPPNPKNPFPPIF